MDIANFNHANADGFDVEPNLYSNAYGDDEEQLIPLEHIQQVQQLADGSALYDVNDPDAQQQQGDGQQDFYENLALQMSSSQLTKLASDITSSVDDDLESRSQWDEIVTKSFEQLGLKVQDAISNPFLVNSSNAVDSTLSSALLRYFSTARAELLPAAGPARTQIVGSPTTEVEDAGERVKTFLNLYLTRIDKAYYPDSERLLMYVGFFGCAFRKVYIDPILQQPVARFIAPQDFIVNNNTTSLLDSSRITQVVQLTRKEILLRQQSGDFLTFKLPLISEDESSDDTQVQSKEKIKITEGIDTSGSENKDLFKFYETHLDLTSVQLSESGNSIAEDENTEVPCPYVVITCLTTRKVVSVRRNWKDGDTKFKRKEYYVSYTYLPGFGLYGLGLAQLCGSNCSALTSILRNLIDAGTLRNFPGGVVQSGLRLEENNKSVEMASFQRINTKGVPIQDCLMPMPYGEPSQVLMALRQELKEEVERLVAVVDSKIPEIGANAPVGTTLAVLETATQLQSCVLRSLHYSMSQELELLYNLFGEFLPDSPYPFSVPGKEDAIMRRDFSDKIRIMPASDPNVLTSTHRLVRAEALLRISDSAPGLYNQREVHKRMCQAMNIDNIDDILPEPPPALSLDPTTENMLLLQGRQVIATIEQANEAHILVHRQFLQLPFVQAILQSNPALYAAVMSHIQEHESLVVWIEMQKQEFEQGITQQYNQAVMQGVMHQEQALLLIQMQIEQWRPQPVDGEQLKQIMMMPQVQNAVAERNAQAVQQEIELQQQQAQAQIDINQVALADVEQKREAANLKAKSDKAKVAAEILKTELQYDSEMTRTDSQRDTAREKHEVELITANAKMENR